MARRKHFPPAGERELLADALQSASIIAASPGLYGASAAQLTAFSLALADLAAALAAQIAAQDAARSARADKEAKMTIVLEQYRLLHRQARTKGVSNALLEAAGLPSVDENRTPIPPPPMVPALLLMKTIGTTHELRVIDKDNPSKRGKPPEVESLLIFRHVGESAPADIAACAFAAASSRMSAMIDNSAADAGKTVWYLCAAANAKGELGPVSEPIRATIAA